MVISTGEKMCQMASICMCQFARDGANNVVDVEKWELVLAFPLTSEVNRLFNCILVQQEWNNNILV